MTPNMERGAWIIIHEWVRVKAWDKVLIVTSKEHQAEAKALEMQARKKARSVNTLIVENKGRHVGIFFDDNEAVFDPYTAIIAATEYSLVTTKAAKRAIQKHKKFLSLPLSTNDGRSLLEFDFLLMDTKKSRMMAKLFMKYLRSSGKVHVTTPAGTDMMFYKENRNPGFFNGVLRDGKAIRPQVLRSMCRSRRQRQRALWCSTDRWDTSDEPMSRRESSSKAAESSISRRHRSASA
mgnify:CR=1 FL=1